MEKKSPVKPLAGMLGTTFAVTLAAAPVAHAQGNPFAAVEYQGGYMVAADEAEAKCGASMGMADDSAKADAAKGEAKKDAAAAKSDEASCGSAGGDAKGAEGKCGN